MGKPIFVIGDSHVRAFSRNNNFFPVFIGPGKENNFVFSNTRKNVKRSLFKVFSELESDSVVLLVLGEPDTRYYLGKGWYPWEGQIISPNKPVEYLVKKSFVRYSRLITRLSKRFDHQICVLNITPSPREDQNEIVNYFNLLLSEFLRDSMVCFIEINDHIYIKHNQIDESFLGDHVHLNNKIQPLVENKLLERGYIESVSTQKQQKWLNDEIKASYVFNDKFGCYTHK